MNSAEYQKLLSSFKTGSGVTPGDLRIYIALALIGLFTLWMVWVCWKHYSLFGQKTIELYVLVFSWVKTVVLYTVFIVTIIIYASM